VPGGGSTGAALNRTKRLALVNGLVGGLAGKRVADLGCGPGDYVRGLLEYTPDVVGVEFDPQAVEQYRGSYAGDEHVEVGDIERLRFDDGSFDVVLLNEVLEHVPDDRRALLEAHRVLRPTGHLVVFSPNRVHPFETHGSATASRREIPFYVPGIPYVPLRVGNRLLRYNARNYWPAELRDLIDDAGFDVTHRTFVWQTFENITGEMPRWMRVAAPILRSVASRLERTPGARRLGISQLLVARPRPARGF
jgi:SAM-dependent methyltransferase